MNHHLIREKFLEKFAEDIDQGVFTLTNDAPLDIADFFASEYGKMMEEYHKQVLTVLTDEIATAHTSEAGKTSRLTSAYNRISALLQSENNQIKS
jgi:hypothetical protein